MDMRFERMDDKKRISAATRDDHGRSHRFTHRFARGDSEKYQLREPLRKLEALHDKERKTLVDKHKEARGILHEQINTTQDSSVQAEAARTLEQSQKTHDADYHRMLLEQKRELAAFARDYMRAKDNISKPRSLHRQVWYNIRHPFAGRETVRANERRRRDSFRLLMENIDSIRGRELDPYFVKRLDGKYFTGRGDAFDEQLSSSRALAPRMEQRNKLEKELQKSLQSLEEMKEGQPEQVQAAFEKAAKQPDGMDSALAQMLPKDAVREFNRIQALRTELGSIHDAEWVMRQQFGSIGNREDNMLQRLTALHNHFETVEYHLMNHKQKRQELRFQRRRATALFLADIIKGLGAAAR